jgi:trigger factor
MEKAVQEALEGDESIRPLPYSTPEVAETPAFDLEKDFTFSVSYDVFPQFSVGNTDGIEVEIPKVEISAEDEGRELEELRQRNAIVIDKESGTAAEKGDVVTVDYAELDASGARSGTPERLVFSVGSGETSTASTTGRGHADGLEKRSFLRIRRTTSTRTRRSVRTLTVT